MGRPLTFMTDTIATTEVTERPSREWATPQMFGFTLIVATIVPFVAAGAQWLTGKTVFFPLQAVIGFLAAVHVPLTAYLLFDASIRDMMRRRPVALILIPILIFAGCFAVFVSTAAQRQSGTASLLVYFALAVLAWNLWHFGKQNIGVYSFFRISQARSRMVPIEKRLIVVAAMLGAMTTFALGSDAYIKIYAKQVNFDGLAALSKYVTLAGSVGQFALFVIVVVVIIAQRSRHNWQSALLFLLSTNYFFPQYLIANGTAGSFIFACNTLGHGLQYCAFLGFHAGHDCEKRERSGGDWSRYLMPAAFIVTALFVADFYIFQKVVSVGGLGVIVSRWFGSPGGLAVSISDAIVTGILLNHFWLDSYFWRFKDAQSRNWMLSRFSFLFQRQAAEQAS
jgi:hypothetical protein